MTSLVLELVEAGGLLRMILKAFDSHKDVRSDKGVWAVRMAFKRLKITKDNLALVCYILTLPS